MSRLEWAALTLLLLYVAPRILDGVALLIESIF